MSAPFQGTQNAGWYRFCVGKLECTALWDGYIHHGYEGIFPNADPTEMLRLKEAYRLPLDHIPMDLNPVVVNTGDRLYLIDAGMGRTSTMFGDTMGRLMENLAAAGFKPGQVDAVLMTHLHPDHSFGLINPDGSKAFPNADLYCSEADWAEWTDESNLRRNDFRAAWTDGTLKAVGPYRDRLKLFNAGEMLAPGLRPFPLRVTRREWSLTSLKARDRRSSLLAMSLITRCSIHITRNGSSTWTTIRIRSKARMPSPRFSRRLWRKTSATTAITFLIPDWATWCVSRTARIASMCSQ